MMSRSSAPSNTLYICSELGKHGAVRHFFLVLFLSVFFFVASAINNKMTQQNQSIHLLYALEEGELVECGERCYDEEQILRTTEHAVYLQRIGETRGSSSFLSCSFFSVLLEM